MFYHTTRDTCSTMFTAVLFVIARNWKQPSCPSPEEWIKKWNTWIKKMWYMYTMEYYPAIKNKDIMNFAIKWRGLENIILSKVTQTQKDIHGMYSLINRY